MKRNIRKRRSFLFVSVLLLALLVSTMLFISASAEGESVKVEKYSLTLNENIDLNFYVKLNNTTPDKVTATFSASDEGVGALTAAAVKKGEFYVYTYRGITPQYLDRKITLTLSCDGLDDVTYTASAADYLTEQTGSTDVGALATALLNYGAAAQDYTGLGVTVGSLDLAAPTVKVAYPMALTGTKSDNVSFLSAGLILSNDVKMYFNVSTSLTNPTVRIGGTTTDNFTFDGERVVVSLSAGQLFDEVTVNFSDGQAAHYSVAQYTAKKSGDGSKLAYLTERLYVYADAVHAFVGNRHYPVFANGTVSCAVCGHDFAALKALHKLDFTSMAVGTTSYKSVYDDKPGDIFTWNATTKSGIVLKGDQKLLYLVGDNASKTIYHAFAFAGEKGEARDFIVFETEYLPAWETDGEVQCGRFELALRDNSGTYIHPLKVGVTDEKITLNGTVTQMSATADTFRTLRYVVDTVNKRAYTYIDGVCVLTEDVSSLSILDGIDGGQIYMPSRDGSAMTYLANIGVYSGNVTWETAETKAPTCTEEGSVTLKNPYTGETKTEVLSVKEHTYDYVKFTSDDGDYVQYACTVCHKENGTKLLQKVKIDYEKDTGDNGYDSAIQTDENGNRYFTGSGHWRDTEQFKLTAIPSAFVYETDFSGTFFLQFNYTSDTETSGWYNDITVGQSDGYITVAETKTTVNSNGWHNFRLVYDGQIFRVYIDNIFCMTVTPSDGFLAAKTLTQIKVIQPSVGIDNQAMYLPEN